MSNKALVGVIGVIATAAVGGLIYHLLNKRDEVVEEVQMEEVKKHQASFPGEITMDQMEADLAEFASKLPEKKREEFYEKYDKLQSDTFIPWLEDPKAVFKLNYIGVCLAFTLHTINRMDKGEDHPDFDACIVETYRIFENLLDELTSKFQILEVRKVKQTGMDVFQTIIDKHFEMEYSDRRVAV